MRIRDITQRARNDVVSAMPPVVWTVPLAVGAIVFLLITAMANREVALAVDEQVAQEEGQFCMKLGLPPGAHYDACLDDVSKLTRRVEQIRANDVL